MPNTLERDFSGCTLVHHLDAQLALTSRGRVITAHGPHGVSKMVTMPFRSPRDLSFGVRPLERLLRADKCLVVPHGDCVVIVRAGVAYRWANNLMALGQIRGDCPLHASACVGRSGALYFGEYFMNPDRQPVRIFRVERGVPFLSIAHEFPAGEIRHVHAIHRDPHVQERLWVTVGDDDGECFLYWTDNEFASVSRVGDGSQLWRAVGLLFLRDKVVWGTDSPHRPNHFVAMDRHTNTLEIGQAVEGTIWYAGMTTDGLFFAGSSVEKGPGVTTDRARVYVSRDGAHWEVGAEFQKDRWPMPLFKWGTISFPSGSFPSDRVWMSGEALRGLDGKSCLLRF